jgi:hypothetical protein
MRSLHRLMAAAIVLSSTAAVAQQAAPEQPADAAQQKAVDEAYLGRCQAAASKDLCACVVAVADSQIDDPTERQVFFDFMMGDVDKAKTARALFGPQKNAQFNAKLQKADVMLGERCDRLKPQPKQ